MDETDPTPAEPPPASGSAPADPGCVIDLDAPLLELADARWLLDKAAAAAGQLGVTGEVRVRVVDDAAMAAAHERYAGVGGTTDVLTFDLSEGPATGELDTDLLVCLDEAARQARDRGHSPRRELLLYIVHGVLHCLGHDDHTEAGFARMHELEDRVLEAIGVGATFGTPAGDTADDTPADASADAVTGAELR